MVSLSSLFGDDADVLHSRNFQVLILANAMGPTGLALVSPLLHTLIGPFETTPANIGLLMSAFTAPGIVMIPLAGLLSDRYGRKPTIIAGLLIMGGAGGAIALTTEFHVVLGLRLLQGIGSAAVVPIVISSIGDLYEGTQEATAQGFRFTSSGLAQLSIPPAAGVLVGVAWQFPFLLYLFAIPAAVGTYLWFEEPTPRAAAATAAESTVDSDRPSLRGLLGSRRVQAMLLVRGLPGVLWVGFLTYNSIIVVEFIGGTPSEAGVLAAVASLSFAVAATQAGRVTALFDSRFYPLVAANVALGGGYAVVVLAGSLPVALAGIAVSGSGFGLILSIYRSIITGLPPAALRGGLVSLSEAFGRLTITAAPIVMGALVAALTPDLGFQGAVQAVGLATAVVVGGGSVLGLGIARAAPPVE
ncbi:MFS transporter [Salinirubellus salinus]|uniref:MFS transporter n=1 Tax=Salinirubellus salinus TaxID=1364945 RepID=A0A9E7R2P1_9EURY|nr:MFS transporter [Salinirubellus salinus]UWM54461.1 MFS transporter [Salinirubellus salinus]